MRSFVALRIPRVFWFCVFGVFLARIFWLIILNSTKARIYQKLALMLAAFTSATSLILFLGAG
jgi:hypothetical protein